MTSYRRRAPRSTSISLIVTPLPFRGTCYFAPNICSSKPTGGPKASFGAVRRIACGPFGFGNLRQAINEPKVASIFDPGRPCDGGRLSLRECSLPPSPPAEKATARLGCSPFTRTVGTSTDRESVRDGRAMMLLARGHSFMPVIEFADSTVAVSAIFWTTVNAFATPSDEPVLQDT
jgi:hypothetical protein